MNAEILVGAYPQRSIEGELLHLREPLSFWGGVDPTSGRLIDPRSSDHGKRIAGKIVALHELRGSSSASSVLLELIHLGLAPIAILLTNPDAILGIAAIVAREMKWLSPPVLHVGRDILDQLDDGDLLSIAENGELRR